MIDLNAVLTAVHTTILVFQTLLGTQVSGDANPAGHWEGHITLPGTELGIRVDLEHADEWKGTIDIPVQGLRGFALGDVIVGPDKVGFRLPNIPGDPEFDGKLDPTANELSGDFRQSGQTFPFKLKRTEKVAIKGETPDKGVPGEGLTGLWQGSITANVFQLRFLFHLEAEGENVSGSLDSLDQNVKGLKITEGSVADQSIELKVGSVGGTYTGTLSGDGSEIDGLWQQGPQKLPLVLKRLAEAPDLSRPQDPKKPYPYVEEQVTFRNEVADIRLAGTLTRPDTPGPHPAVILVSGSGPQDRDESIMGHRPFLVIADHLTRHGIAVLRYDDRGFGESEGRFSKALVADFTTDALAAVQFLKQRSEIQPQKIGIIGHSEGGVVAPQAAVQSSDVAFIVLLAGVGVPLDELLQRQAADILRVMGTDEETLAKQAKVQKEVFALAMKEAPAKEIADEVVALLRSSLEDFTPEQLEAMGFNESNMKAQASTVLSPWFRDLLRLDPRPTLAKVSCPVLALNGEKDIQVAAQENLEAIEKAVRSGGNSQVTIRSFPNLNHLFQNCKTGAVSEYGTIDETIAPPVLSTLSDWVLEQVK